MKRYTRIVYHGPQMAGKTTNLQVLRHLSPAYIWGELAEATEIYRQIFMYSEIPLAIDGRACYYEVKTTPGCVLYTRTRTDLLQTADGVVCVLDSRNPFNENDLVLQELIATLRQRGADPEHFPIVLQYNKRDLSPDTSFETLQERYNALGWPAFEAAAAHKRGVAETFREICRLIVHAKAEGD